ncbi:MAG: SDR family NAD(P)-dependent oxidoreductase [Pseudomonadota bacterium]
MDAFDGMTRLGEGYRALVIGATGGIGHAFAELITADQRCGRCFTTSRSAGADLQLDVTHERSIADAATALVNEGPLHLIIDATGLLHDGALQPEKSLAAVDPDHVARAFAVNATGPLLLLKHFAPLLDRAHPTRFATLSARVSSISDNRLGGWYAYRAAKAALNMFVKNAAIEIARKAPDAVIVGLHPGTVETALSEPFAGKRELFTPQKSAALMLQVLDGLSPTDTGGLFAYDSARIPW